MRRKTDGRFRLGTTQHGDAVDVASHRTLRDLAADVWNALHCHCVVEWIEENGERWTPEKVWEFVSPIADDVAQHEAKDATALFLGRPRHPLDRRAEP